MAYTEAPVEYNTWAGISAISASLKRNVWINCPGFVLFPNTYIILVGPPGVGKGTAINPILSLLEESGTANILPDRITAEKVVERISDGWGTGTKITGGKVTITNDRTAIIAATELPIYLNSSVWTLELMCDLWDNKPGGTSYSTKTKNSFTAKDTCVSLVGGCVPDYIRKLNKDAMTAVTGGFTTRCVFVYATEKSKLVYPWGNKNGSGNTKLWKDLINDLQHINTLTGEFNFSYHAKQLWEQHYSGYAKTDPYESEVLQGFKSRTMAHVFKTAMALAVAESDKLEINEQHLNDAIKLVNNVRSKVDVVFRCVGESSQAVNLDRILTFIDREGMTSRAKIMKVLGRHIGSMEELEKILRVLFATNQAEERTQGSTLMIFSLKTRGFTKP